MKYFKDYLNFKVRVSLDHLKMTVLLQGARLEARDTRKERRSTDPEAKEKNNLSPLTNS